MAEFTRDTHPLEPLVLQAFAKNPRLDGYSLGSHLAGYVGECEEEYRIVALDVLNYMRHQGKVTCDKSGDYDGECEPSGSDDGGWYMLLERRRPVQASR